jgi:hypothetical protein
MPTESSIRSAVIVASGECGEPTEISRTPTRNVIRPTKIQNV